MKADLYVQGKFWASIIIPGDTLLALLASSMLAEANLKTAQLANELTDLNQVQCSVSLRFSDPVTYGPSQGD